MPPRSPFLTHPLFIGAGLNLIDAPERKGPGEAQQIENMRIDGEGRIGPRLATGLITSPTGDQVGLFRFPFYSGATPIGGIAVQYLSGSSAVVLQRVGLNGVQFGSTIAAWTGVTARPIITGAVIGQKLFLGGRFAGGRLAMKYFQASTETVITPQFNFVPGGSSATMSPRVLAEWNNILWAGGFGTEDDVDRGEILRFSFIGLEDDEEGAGDAGDSGVAGSTNIFDIDDLTPLGERGASIMAMGRAQSRLVVVTARTAHHIFGSDRFSFDAKELDGELGTDSQQSFVLGNGTAYWWSRTNGPVEYAGSHVEDIGYQITPRLPEINGTEIIGIYRPAPHNVVRFVYPYTNSDGSVTSRFVEWNRKLREWHGDGMLPFRIFCVGAISTSSTNVTSGAVTAPSGPAGPPTSLNVSGITSTGATIGFTPGDTSTGTQHEVRIAGVLVATLDANVASYVASGLSPSTSYAVDIRSLKNGQYSSSLTGSFTTSSSGSTPAAPTGLTGEQITGFDGEPNDVSLQWTLGQSGMNTQIFRKLDGGSYPATPLTTQPIDSTSYIDLEVALGQTYVYKVRHQHPSDPALLSGFSNEVTVGPITAGGLP